MFYSQKRKRFSLLPSPPYFGTNPASYSIGTEVLSPEIRRPRREVVRLPPSRTEGYASAPFMCLQGVRRDKLTVLIAELWETAVNFSHYGRYAGLVSYAAPLQCLHSVLNRYNMWSSVSLYSDLFLLLSDLLIQKHNCSLAKRTVLVNSTCYRFRLYGVITYISGVLLQRNRLKRMWS